MAKIRNFLLKHSLIGIFLGVTVVGGVFALHKYILPMIKAPKNQELNLGGKKSPKLVKPKNKAVRLEMKDVYFLLTNKIAFNVSKIQAKLYPTGGASAVNFDDVNAFFIDIYSGLISLEPQVLQTVFNEIVFNYEGSTLKDLKMSFVDYEKDGQMVPRIKLTGEMQLMGLWLGFEMIGSIGIDKSQNLMVMEAEKITTLGNPYTKALMSAAFLDLESFIKVPDGRGVKMKGNKIIISPFKIFPPPALNGTLHSVQIDTPSNKMVLEFQRPEKLTFPAPMLPVKSYLMIKGGSVQFGKLVMYGADLLMVDADPKDTFVFYLANYFKTLVKGQSHIMANRSVIAYMPDYDDVVKK